MKNKYRIEDDIVYIQLSNSELETLIDIDDLQKVKDLNTTIRLNKSTGYAQFSLYSTNGTAYHQKDYLLHRHIMDYPNKMYVVDHINRNRLDNRRSKNLRVVTQSENCMNRAEISTGESGIRNVYRSGSKWKVLIRENSKPKYLGTYSTVEQAQEVANNKRKSLQGVD